MARNHPLLSPSDAAKRLSDAGLPTTEQTVRDWAKSGRLRHVLTPGGRYKFRPSDVDAILEPEQVAEGRPA